MYQINTVRKVQFSVVALLVIVFAQVAHAAPPIHCLAQSTTPQWVLDRQQYETTYVYALDDSPQSYTQEVVADRYQYDPAYVVRESTVAQNQGIAVPQWVLDRQQYEPTYTYAPEKTVPSEQCSIS